MYSILLSSEGSLAQREIFYYRFSDFEEMELLHSFQSNGKQYNE